MKKITNFQDSAPIELGSIWGGTTPVCWTHSTEVGATHDPCGNVDNRDYMTQD